MNAPEINYLPEAFTAITAANLEEFAAHAYKEGAQPAMLIANQHRSARPDAFMFLAPVLVLRPPTDATRYQKAQPGVACSMGGQLYALETSPNSGSLVLRHDCPHEGIDPATVDEVWLSALLDAAEASLKNNSK